MNRALKIYVFCIFRSSTGPFLLNVLSAPLNEFITLVSSCRQRRRFVANILILFYAAQQQQHQYIFPHNVLRTYIHTPNITYIYSYIQFLTYILVRSYI